MATQLTAETSLFDALANAANRADNMKDIVISTKKNILISSFIMATIGILIIFCNNAFTERMPTWINSSIATLGGTVFAFGMFGIAVDWWFKRELAEDVFRAAAGYLLPEELREEMKWIYAQHIVCDEHHTTIQLDEINEKTHILMKVKTNRKLRNVGSSMEWIKPGASVDEWLHASRHSRIKEVGYQYGCTTDKIDDKSAIKNGSTLSVLFAKKIALQPNGDFYIWSSTEEVKHRNDSFYFTLSYATRSPKIEVIAPDGIAFQVRFAHREGSGRALGSTTTRLSGTLLPTQHVAVRWWDKAAAERWQSADQVNQV